MNYIHIEWENKNKYMKVTTNLQKRSKKQIIKMLEMALRKIK